MEITPARLRPHWPCRFVGWGAWFRCLAAGAALTAPWVDAPAAGVIRIGQSLPDSPESYKISTSIGYATNALVESVNALGGIDGRMIELVTLKDDGTASGYARNVTRLLEDEQVLAVVNCTGDARCLEGQRLVREHDAALVGAMSGVPALHVSDGHVFPVRADYPAEAKALARQLATIGVATATVLTDGHSLPIKRDALAEAMKSAGIATTMVEVKADKTSIGRALDHLMTPPINALMLDLGAASLAVTGELLQEKAPELPAVIASLADPELTLSIGIFRGRTYGFTSVVPNPESQTSALATAFRQDLVNAPFGISYAGLEAYLNLRVVIEALRSIDKVPTRSTLLNVLRASPSMTIGELAVSPVGQGRGAPARVGLGVISARGIVLE
ncbi:ABC transporter substrate-binding protein [Nitrogeniibacter aestuarii]|uniref:ABC transporter substrate-binding protein n=1 Tax=Nitrogeniibacter aestuarii TaxID=2815343 RepID=UPI001E46D993|nr:ABC transporter substrate-binding protein [Nitrogeniibacter aestuarii]